MLSPAFHQASWLFSNSRKPTSMLYEGKHIHLLVGGLLAYGYTVNKYHFLLYSPPFFGKFFIRPKIVSFEKSLFLFLVSLSQIKYSSYLNLFLCYFSCTKGRLTCIIVLLCPSLTSTFCTKYFPFQKST